MIFVCVNNNSEPTHRQQQSPQRSISTQSTFQSSSGHSGHHGSDPDERSLGVEIEGQSRNGFRGYQFDNQSLEIEIK